jgi:curli production assembly/transport component CsgG
VIKLRTSMIGLALGASLSLGACSTLDTGYDQIGAGVDHVMSPAARAEAHTETAQFLSDLPAPRQKLAVAVYGFDDQTGQFKPADSGQTLSKAVTQGATSVLLKALQEAGDRRWFTIIERENLDNLLKERQIIKEMHRQYLGDDAVDPDTLPPMLFAGILLEGGVIGYDSNTLTGGIGARFLGIGGATEYREDKVTVYLRAVSVKTGEVITSVVSTKKIASIGLSANAFRYVSFKELLEFDSGVTSNEPDLLALRQAIEKAVELLILDGAEIGAWEFADAAQSASLLERYRLEKNGEIPADALESLADAPETRVADASSSRPVARASRNKMRVRGRR